MWWVGVLPVHLLISSQVVVSMSSWVLHQNENYFPEPMKLDPERWADTKEAQRLEEALVPFGKCSRVCVGMKQAGLVFWN